MGITIHYKGTIEDLALIGQVQDEMVELCQSMKWEYQLFNEDLTQPFSAVLKHNGHSANIEGHIPLKGIIISTEPENESLNLLFNPEGKLSSFMLEIMNHDGTFVPAHHWVFVKTQFGSIDSHIAIVKLLRHMKDKYIPDLEVNDEGEYWETGDKEHLAGKRGFLAGKISQLTQALSNIEIEKDLTSEEIADKIEKILQRMQDKKK